MRQRDPALNTDRQAAILAAAAACFVRRGFHAASMKDIAAEAGLSPATLYHYLPSKAAIVAAIIEAERASVARILAALADAPALRAGLSRGLRQVLAEMTPVELRLRTEIAAEILRDPALRDLARHAEAEATRLLAARIAAAQAAGEVAPSLDPMATAIAIGALVEGLLWRAALLGEDGAGPLDAGLDRLLAAP